MQSPRLLLLYTTSRSLSIYLLLKMCFLLLGRLCLLLYNQKSLSTPANPSKNLYDMIYVLNHTSPYIRFPSLFFFFVYCAQFVWERTVVFAPFCYALIVAFISAISAFISSISSASFCSHSSMLEAYTLRMILLPLIFGEYRPSHTFLLT